MADNVALPALSGTVATDDVAVNGGSSAQVQYVKLVDGTANGTAGLPGDATNGLDVDVTRVIPGTTATALGKAEDAAHASGDTGVMALGVHNTTATADGTVNNDYASLSLDPTRHLRTIDALSEVTLSNSTTTALDNDGPVVKGSAGTLYGFQGYCDAAGYVQVHNKATAPASTNVPVIVIPVAAGAPFSLDFGMRGRAFSTGIAFGFSSTGPTYTDGGSHLWVDAQFT
jgi:hypothetical protein